MNHEDTSDQWYRDGSLAAALANAQAAFPTITRDKQVTVKTKTGGTYTFKYAPLDSILNAVREPLYDNGLAITQLLDEGALVTRLLHKDGGSLTGRLPIPEVEGVQAFGSAITYLRRYSIQAILGIAAEEDDDGNQAAGNTATVKPITPAEQNAKERAVIEKSVTGQIIREGDGGSLIGTGELAKDYIDFLPKQTPDGMGLAFKLMSDAGSIKVLVTGTLAEVLPTLRDEIIGKRISCWGRVVDIPYTGKRKDGTTFSKPYQALVLERIKTESGTLPMVEAPTAPLFEGPMFEGMGDDDKPT